MDRGPKVRKLRMSLNVEFHMVLFWLTLTTNNGPLDSRLFQHSKLVTFNTILELGINIGSVAGYTIGAIVET